MMQKTLEKTIEVGFIECPHCKALFESMLGVDDNTMMCHACKKHFSHDKAKIRVLQKPFVICTACDFKISLTPGNQDWGSGETYICPKCRKVVAFADGYAAMKN
jgi:phage FluMu protein Com